MRRHLFRDEFVIELVAATEGVSLPVGTVWIEGIAEMVSAFVGMRIGPFGRAQKAESKRISFCVISIFILVQQTDADAVSRRNVCPTQRGDLKFCFLFRSIARGRPLDAAVGYLKSCLVVPAGIEMPALMRMCFSCQSARSRLRHTACARKEQSAA